MASAGFLLFLARRIAQRTPGNRPGVMERVAVVAVALSMAVMILAMAVVMGFKREIAERVTGFSAHVEVTQAGNFGPVGVEPLLCGERLERTIRGSGPVVGFAPYALKGGVVKTPDAMLGVALKGVDGRYDWRFFGDCLVEGRLPRVGDSLRAKDVLISQVQAREARLAPGDKIEMLFIEPEGKPRRDRFRVSGIYATGLDEFDRTVMMTDLRNVQRLCGWSSDEVSGCEVMLERADGAEVVARRLRETFAADDAFRDLTARSVRERYPLIFDWLTTHDVNAAVILVIMVVVAVFNMATALLTLVLERTRMIGLLKTMGMNDASLRGVFLYRALFIILRGAAWGNAVGLGLCLVQRYFHVATLDPEGYMLSEVPVAFGWGWWLALNAGAVVVILTMLVLPASIISRIRPDESIRSA